MCYTSRSKVYIAKMGGELYMKNYILAVLACICLVGTYSVSYGMSVQEYHAKNNLMLTLKFGDLKTISKPGQPSLLENIIKSLNGMKQIAQNSMSNDMNAAVIMQPMQTTIDYLLATINQQETVVPKPQSPPPYTDPCLVDLVQHIQQCEQKFLGTPDITRLTEGYDNLKKNLLNDKHTDSTFIKQLDDSLEAIYLESSSNFKCNEIAESYKLLADSSELQSDYIKAAFWFRMLFIVKNNDALLSTYNALLTKAKNAKIE